MVDKPYWQKLKDPRWQKKRLEILERDKWRCQSCYEGLYENLEGDEQYDLESLQVHHKSYEWGKDPWDYPNWNFVTLCESCHQNEADIKLHEKQLLVAFRRNGFLSWHFEKLNHLIELNEQFCGATLSQALESWSLTQEELADVEAIRKVMQPMTLSSKTGFLYLFLTYISERRKKQEIDNQAGIKF